MQRIVVGLLLAIALFAPTLGQAEYASLELYPNAMPFFCCGSTMNFWKIDGWVGFNSEIGVTVGPVIKGLALGAGCSIGNDAGKNRVIYLNFDAAYTYTLNEFSWSTYNILQLDQLKSASSTNFGMSRNWFKHESFPLGIVGKNDKVGAAPWKLYWGPYCDIGEIKGTKANKLCLAYNLNNTTEYWVAWIIDF